MNSDAFSLVIWTVGREPKEVSITQGEEHWNGVE